jgi:hypothetical protein
LTASPAVAQGARHQNLYADGIWRQQRFFAAFLIAIGMVMTGLAIYQHQFGHGAYGAYIVWTLYIPSGLLLGGVMFLYRWRSHVRVLDTGVHLSSWRQGVLIDFDSIRMVKVRPLREHFLERRSRLIAPIMKQHIDKPALFLRLKVDDAELAAIQKKLGRRMMDGDTIAVPVPDADALAWEITAHLPERIGQNLGGGKRRKRHR